MGKLFFTNFMKLIYLFNKELMNYKTGIIPVSHFQVISFCLGLNRNIAKLELHLWKSEHGIDEDVAYFSKMFKNISNLHIRFHTRSYLKLLKLLYLNKSSVFYTRSAYTYIIGKILRREVVFEIHNYLISPNNLRGKFTTWLFKKISNNSSARIVVISEELKKYWIKRISKANFLVLHDCISADDYSIKPNKLHLREELNLPLNKSIVIYSGNITQHPQFDRGVKNVIKMAKKIPQAEFLIVGGPNQSADELQLLVQDYKLQNVIITGIVDRELVSKYLFSSDISLMFASNKLSWINYFSPMKLFEYMGAGTTTVAFGYPTIYEIIEDGKDGFIVERDNFDKMTKKVEEILQYDIKFIGNNARDKVLKNYTWENRGEKLLKWIKFIN